MKTGKQIQKRKLFSLFTVQQYLLNEEILTLRNLYYDYLESLQNNDEGFFKKTLETNYYKYLRDYLDKFNNSSFRFELFEPKKMIFEVDFLHNQTFEGVFIERCLNYGKTEYFIKEAFSTKHHKFSGKPQKLFEKTKNMLIHDEELKEENIEDLRKSYRLQFIIVQIQTKVRLNIWEKNQKNLIFGSEDEDLIETRYLQVEHKFIESKAMKKKFIITDVDNILHGNPHIV
jgi:hypothetical protein